MDERMQYAVTRLKKFKAFVKTIRGRCCRIMQDKMTYVFILFFKHPIVVFFASCTARVTIGKIKRPYRENKKRLVTKEQNSKTLIFSEGPKIKCTKSIVPPNVGTYVAKSVAPIPTWMPAFAGKKISPLSRTQKINVKSTKNIILLPMASCRAKRMTQYQYRKKKIKMRRGFRRIKSFKRLRYAAIWIAIAHRLKAISSHTMTVPTHLHRHVHESFSKNHLSQSSIISPFSFFKRTDINKTSFTSSKPAHIFKLHSMDRLQGVNRL